ncbi:MAG TPA: S8 family serine peptidase [Acidimicrobiia bacterium]|nr:S8 family serine peptidase [Acidimicrobiia bacterium]
MRSRLLILVTIAATTLLAIPASAAAELDEYVVVLRPTNQSVADVAQEIAGQHGGRVGFVYTTALQGFTVTLPQQAAHALARNPNVAYIEPVVEVEAVGTQPIPTGIDRIDGDLNPPTPPMDVDIAILDTGIYIGTNGDGSPRSHLDLNLVYVNDCTDAIFYPMFGSCTGTGSIQDFQDGHGHGTHVAGIAAARDNDIGSIGVAPGATLHSFKVLRADGTGTSGMILAGIDGVAARADLIEVANMSLGFLGESQAINDAISGAVDAGVTFVAAAGNSAVDAGGFSPANAPDAIAVSALADFDGLPGGLGSPTCRADQDDTLADFSNFGPIVDIAAPGVCIFSTHLNDGYTTFSGTSMASPFVAGAIARYIAENDLPTNNRADVDAIRSAVIGAATPQNSLCGFEDVDDDPEPLLSVNAPLFGGDGTCAGEPGGNAAPLAQFSHHCTDLSCQFTDESSDPDGSIVSWSWDFGQGSTSSEQNPTHVFAGPGDYDVTLAVTDDGGATTEITMTIGVSDGPPPNGAPTASFTYSCVDLDCTFTNTSTDPEDDPLTYTWDFGDGNATSTVSPAHSYSTAGTYPVELTVSDGESSHTAAASVTVSDSAPATEIGGTVNPIVSTGRDAEAAIAVFDDNGEFVGGATVQGYFTYVDNRGRERTTEASAVSEADDIGYKGFLANTLVIKRVQPNSTVTGFCITDIVAPGYTYVLTGFECWPWGGS